MYCNDHPLANFGDAAAELLKSLPIRKRKAMRLRRGSSAIARSIPSKGMAPSWSSDRDLGDTRAVSFLHTMKCIVLAVLPRYDGIWSRELPVEARTRQPVRTLGLNFSIPLLGGPPTRAEIWAALPATSNAPAHLTDAVADNRSL